MIKNYLLIAFRNLQRNTIYSFINIVGLSVGLACSILILLWVSNELSYDRFHANYERIYQVYANQEINGSIETTSLTPYPVMDAIRNKSSQVKHVALVNHGEGYLVANGENRVSKMGTVATGDFLEIFSFNLVKGNLKKALNDPTSVVLTQSTAKALFGNEDALGKVITIENTHELKVNAIIEDVPSNSSIQFDFLLPARFYESTQAWFRRAMTDWENRSFQVFVELQEGASLPEVNAAVEGLIKQNVEHAHTAKVFLYPMSQWHLYSDFSNGVPSGGIIEYVRMFSAIAVFILVIACINFMNLATARSESRAREVGIRKTVGSGRKQLVFQFLGESLLITTIAFLLAMVVVEAALPFYNDMVGKSLAIRYTSAWVWISGAAIILVTGILSGSYPAFYLSGFQPIKVLKGKVVAGAGAVTPRKVMVTLQFGFSIFLIIGTLAIYQQISHVKARHVGYNRENLMLMWTSAEREKYFESIREELVRSGVARSVTKSSAPITRIFSSTDDVKWPGKQGTEKVGFVTIATQYDFTETMGIKLLEGRDFSPQFGSDTSAVVVNQAAIDLMGLKDPIGQTIHMWGDDRVIIGVMEDVIMGSPYDPVDPMAMVMIPEWSSTISVRLNPADDIQASVNTVEKIFKKYDPEHPLWHRFADAEFETKFTTINLIGKLAWAFAFLAIAISCLGLFGLAAFTAEQRTKEVGIRKILGASVSSLVLLISKDFSRLVVLAFVISAPIAWWMMERFLEQYPYRISLPLWVLPAAGLGALALTLAIVSTQAFRAARSNPTNSLRNE